MQAELPALQLYQADLLDGAALRTAFTGAKALFLVTDFYTDKNLDKAEHGVSGELEEGTNVLKVAKELGIEYMLVSSLVNAEDITHGKWKGR
jgi:sugar phosphate isomerase/epimerase